MRISDWSSDVCSSDLLRHAVHQVTALDLHGAALAVLRRAGRADFLLDALGRAFTDQEVMVAADVGDDRLVQLVATDAHRARVHDAAQREHRPPGGAAADVDDHGAGRGTEEPPPDTPTLMAQ